MSDTITITGNVATDPEHRHTAAGIPITTFRVASTQRRHDRQTGTWVDAGTNWYTVSAFRRLAANTFHSLRKGDRVVVNGRLRLKEWENGTKKGITADIEADAVGHDLLWGTTSFTKGSATSPSGTSPAAEDEWASPVTPVASAPPSSPAGEWPVAILPDASPQQHSAELAETPF